MADCVLVAASGGRLRFPCGKCINCRSARGGELAARMEFEARVSGSVLFVTVTYDEQSLPEGGNLSRAHARRLTHFVTRAAPVGLGARVVLLAHYGSRYARPHYHFALFFPLGVVADPDAVRFRLESFWRAGMVDVRLCDSGGFAYLARHQVLSREEVREAEGRGLVAPWVTWSRRPALGVDAFVSAFSPWFVSDAGQEWLSEHMDVPGVVGSRNFVRRVGRTARAKLRAAVGLPDLRSWRSERFKADHRDRWSDPQVAALRRVHEVNNADVREKRAAWLHRRRKT